jgi:ATP synthase protein I
MPDEPETRGRSAPDPDDKALAEQLSALRSRIAAVEARKAATAPKETASRNYGGLGQALKLSGEFTAGILVGLGLGLACDHFFGTSPWGLIGFMLLGFGAGMMNVMRSVGAWTPRRLPGARDPGQD